MFSNPAIIEREEILRPWLIRVAINLARNATSSKIRANTRKQTYVKQTLEVVDRSKSPLMSAKAQMGFAEF
ncbi:MAG: hypothetical protein C4325_08720 [Blastocatellia bacterium]